MQLIVEELVTSVSQSITVGASNIKTKYLRPYLYKHGTPAGSLYLEIQDSSGKKIGVSETITIASITTASNTYFHGWVRFLATIPLKASTTYKVALKSSGYTYSASAFVGWCLGWDNAVADADYSPSSDLEKALNLQIFGTKEIVKGAV